MKRAMCISGILGIFIALSTVGQNSPPLVPDIGSIGIVNCIYLEKYETDQYTVTEEAGYRMALLTLKIEKPAGAEIEIAAADITLHYYHGDDGTKEEVAPCDAISTFSKRPDDDKPLKTLKCSPGWMKRTSGAHTSASSEVYLDVVFRKVENNISKMWICIAQPYASQTTSGWELTRKDREALEEE